MQQPVALTSSRTRRYGELMNDTTDNEDYPNWPNRQKIERALAHIFDRDGNAKPDVDRLERIIFFEGSCRGISVANLIDECFHARGRLYFMLLRKHNLPDGYPNDDTERNQLKGFERSANFEEYLRSKLSQRHEETKMPEEQNVHPDINPRRTPIAFFYGIQKYLAIHREKEDIDVDERKLLQQELEEYQRMFDFSDYVRVANAVGVDEYSWKIKPVTVKLFGEENWKPEEIIAPFFHSFHKYVLLWQQVDFNLTFREEFELEAFPFDFQDLTMKFETKEKGYRFAPGFRSGSWFICDAKKFPCQSHVFECLEVYFEQTKASRSKVFKARSAVKVNIKASRQYQVYIYNVYIPVILLLIASLIPIYNPTIGDNFDPTGYTIGLVLAQLVFLQSIEKNLPHIPYFTHANRFVFTATLFIFAVLIRMGFGRDTVHDNEQYIWVFIAVSLVVTQAFYVLLLWTRERWIANKWLKSEISLRHKNDKFLLSHLFCRQEKRRNNHNCNDEFQDPLVAELVQPSLARDASDEKDQKNENSTDYDSILTVDVRDIAGQKIDTSEKRVGVYFCQRSWFGEKDYRSRCLFLSRMVTWILDALVPLKLFERYLQELEDRQAANLPSLRASGDTRNSSANDLHSQATVQP